MTVMKKSTKLLVLLMCTVIFISLVCIMYVSAEEQGGNVALGKTVYFSSEEGKSSSGSDTHAENAVDGNKSTAWVAHTKDASGAWAAEYPEWLCVDLGGYYSIDGIDLQLESKNGKRTYDFNVYVSKDVMPDHGTQNIPEGFVKILEKKDNKDSGVQPTITCDVAEVRYVLVEFISCNQYDSNKWQAATVYELAVYGTKTGDIAGEGDSESVMQTASGRDNIYAAELGGTWLFGGRGLAAEAALKSDHANWSSVTVPHTWNASDGEDGGGNYERTSYWYHKKFTLDAKNEGKRIYIEFLGSNTQTDVYVNGSSVGATHKGGYTTFRYDITDYVNIGENTLDVRVDNTFSQEIAPISGDFNMYGGIYRRVYLIAVDSVHVDLDNYGSSGLMLTTGNMRSLTKPEDLGKFTVNTEIVNSSDKDRAVTVEITVEGDNAPEKLVKKITVPANGTYKLSELCEVENPTLWEGADYSKDADTANVGYRYTVTLTVKDGSTVIDKVTDKIGFRYFYVDEENGFYLNGEKYQLRGVNRHSFLAGVGSAMTEEDHMKDMEIVLELGANCIRLCHYPQTDYFYDLCDENGIVVWTEIPLVNMIGSASTFTEITKNQLTELILQQYNRPSVIFWGLENEIGNGTSLSNATSNALVAKAKALLYELDALAHELDTTGRYTTQAINRDYAMDQGDPNCVNGNFENNIGWKSDLIAWNIYPGWYNDANFYGTFEDVMERKLALDSRAMGISEYGWGANVNQHESDPKLGLRGLTAGGFWHPEEYQSIMNEAAVEYINSHDELWGTFYWALFDFSVDSRNEGSQIALNDKGLVTEDRSVKKDSFYLYKANWNESDTFAYITSRRFTERTNEETYVKVYSNCDEVILYVNGEELGEMENKGNGVFVKENVTLPLGEVEIKVVGRSDVADEEYTDSCTWNVTEKQESDDGNLALDKPVYASSEEGLSTDGALTVAYNAVDGDTASRWVARTKDASGAWDAAYPEWICVDLGDVYDLTKIGLILEAKGGRTYEYAIYVSDDVAPVDGGEIPDGYKKIYERKNNKESGEQTGIDLENVSGRYVLVEIIGCSAYSSSAKYAAACVYELSVYGELKSDDSDDDGTTDDTTSPGTGDSDDETAPQTSSKTAGFAIVVLLCALVIAAWLRRKQTFRA